MGGKGKRERGCCFWFFSCSIVSSQLTDQPRVCLFCLFVRSFVCLLAYLLVFCLFLFVCLFLFGRYFKESIEQLDPSAAIEREYLCVFSCANPPFLSHVSPLFFPSFRTGTRWIPISAGVRSGCWPNRTCTTSKSSRSPPSSRRCPTIWSMCSRNWLVCPRAAAL